MKSSWSFFVRWYKSKYTLVPYIYNPRSLEILSAGRETVDYSFSIDVKATTA